MGNKKHHWWHGVPWGWVLVSIYCTTLVCVGASQLVSQDAAIAFVKDFQTLIAGVATIVALFIAAQQLRRQVDRDAIDAKRHYQTELDALKELDTSATSLASAASRKPDPFDAALPYRRAHWDRLRLEVNASTASSVSTVMTEVEAYNGLVARDNDPSNLLSFGIGFGPDYSKQHQWERQRVYVASMLLLAAVQERRTVVLREIESTS